MTWGDGGKVTLIIKLYILLVLIWESKINVDHLIEVPNSTTLQWGLFLSEVNNRDNKSSYCGK